MAKAVRVRVSPSAPTKAAGAGTVSLRRGKVRVISSLTMNLDQYLPVLLFILVGIGVGVAPQVLGWLSSCIGVRNGPTRQKIPPTNAASRPSRTRA